MSGLGVLFFIGLYFFIAYKVVKAIKTKPLKWLAIVILVLIPTADEMVGRVYLQHLCATEGGLKVHRMVNGVEGFIGAWGDEPDAMPVEKYDYSFSEGRPWKGRVKRYSKQNGQIVKENDVLPKSNYRLSLLDKGEVKDSYMRQTLVVETFPVGEVLATDTQIGFNGGWVAHLLASFGGTNPVWCESKDSIVRYEELILSTLKH